MEPFITKLAFFGGILKELELISIFVDWVVHIYMQFTYAE